MSASDFILPELNFGFGRRLPMVLQSEAAECGLACLVMIAGYHGYYTDLITLRQRFLLSLRGSTLKNVADMAAAMHFSSRPIQVELDDLPHLQMPCILHWDMNHFVVLRKVNTARDGSLVGIVIHDPARGELKLGIDEVSAKFTGIALELTTMPGFESKQEKKQIRLRDILDGAIGLKSSLAHIFLLAMALEAFSLVSPFFMQLVVDGAILSSDRDLLTMLALGFGLLMLVQTAIGLFRSWVVLYMSTHLNLQWMAGVFTHLIHLPMSYFEKRSLGNVVSRFGSVQSIQRTLSTTFVETLIDGLLAIATLATLFIYNFWLSIVALVSVALYALSRWAMYPSFRRANEEQINLQAREQSLFLESIRGIQAIKLFNHEDERRARWLNALVAAVNRSISTQKMILGYSTTHALFAGIESIVIVFLGARLVMDNTFSIGMLYAFISYKATFTGRIYSLIDNWLSIKMISLQTERLADIVITKREDELYQKTPIEEVDIGNQLFGKSGLPDAQREIKDITIEVRDLWFRYSDDEPWIIQALYLTISPGESVAITGPSGCGKTTLLKLLLGLLIPNQGEIFIGGLALSRLGLRNYRNLIGAVMQDDNLLGGTIAENISFFDVRADQDWLAACATAAALTDEIHSMPMGFQTMIGDMGSSLSGGQRQRLLLARALYKRPRLLFLDEATSHLDMAKESQVNKAIIELKLTRIIVAHRTETIRSANRVIELNNGKILSDSGLPCLLNTKSPYSVNN